MDGTDRNGSAVPASATRTGISVKLPAIAASMPSARLMWRKAFWPLQLGAVVFPPDGHAMNSVPFGWKNPSQFAPFMIPGAGPEAPVRTHHTSGSAPISTEYRAPCHIRRPRALRWRAGERGAKGKWDETMSKSLHSRKGPLAELPTTADAVAIPPGPHGPGLAPFGVTPSEHMVHWPPWVAPVPDGQSSNAAVGAIADELDGQPQTKEPLCPTNHCVLRAVKPVCRNTNTHINPLQHLA